MSMKKTSDLDLKMHQNGLHLLCRSVAPQTPRARSDRRCDRRSDRRRDRRRDRRSDRRSDPKPYFLNVWHFNPSHLPKKYQLWVCPKITFANVSHFNPGLLQNLSVKCTKMDSLCCVARRDKKRPTMRPTSRSTKRPTTRPTK